MSEELKSFFQAFEKPDFLTMKLLLGVFNKMKRIDDGGRKIVSNINVLSEYNLRLLSSDDFSSYVSFDDDLSDIDMEISIYSTEYTACHELGHLLLNVFARGEVPEEFKIVNDYCKKRLLNDREYVSNLLQQYRDNVFDKLCKEVDVMDLDDDSVVEKLVLVSAFDQNIEDCNRISNILDSIFIGNNPFCLDYGNDEIDPILAMHPEEYFIDDGDDPEYISFEEQFADYLVLRVYREQNSGVINKLYSLIGSQWFSMMDKHYDMIADRMAEKGKVYKYK